MANTVAALRGKLGSTDYYILAMKAKELIEKAIIPSEIDGWEEKTLEEIEQRDINYKRVKDQIAPYLASDDDRFFGAIIVAAQGFDPDNFEPISEVASKGLPKLYKIQANLMGFLTFAGGELLIPLDGQHRLKAIKFAIEGKDHEGKPIPGLKPCTDLANEEVTVILVNYEVELARKIFTKVNRHAKQTTTGQNLVTDDDDIIAILSRHITNTIIGPELVKYKTNTLNTKDPHFTTLATIAVCNEAILSDTYATKIDRNRPVDEQKKHHYQSEVEEVWEYLVENISLFNAMLQDKNSEEGNRKRCEIREDYLLGKPAPQACLVRAFSRLINLNPPIDKKTVVDKLNSINWSKTAPEWDRLLVAGDRILTKNANIVTDIICYRAGEPLGDKEKQNLLERYRELFPPEDRENLELPPLL